MALYKRAAEPAHIAKFYLEANHSHLSRNKVPVIWLFTDTAPVVKGKEVIATTRRVSGFAAVMLHLAGNAAGDYIDDYGAFAIIIYEKMWEAMNSAQRNALLDHELCHCWSEEKQDREGNPTGRIALSILPHDCEEFYAVAARHGEWSRDITKLMEHVQIGRQLSLNLAANDNQAEPEASDDFQPSEPFVTAIVERDNPVIPDPPKRNNRGNHLRVSDSDSSSTALPA